MHGTPGGHDLDALYERWEEWREIGALGEVLAECGFPKITGRLIGTSLRGPYHLAKCGHRFGAGRESKTEFPRAWGDERIILAVIDTVYILSSYRWVGMLFASVVFRWWRYRSERGRGERRSTIP